jgi:magnesium chelatase family protein
MLAAVRSAAVIGIDAYDVLVEVDVALGLPMWTIVGLAAGAVKESRERVSAALANSGFAVPPRRVTINLAPADVRKEGTAFDLPIALGFLAATGQLDAESLAGMVAIGELGLDGSLRPVRGALSVARRLAGSGRKRRTESGSVTLVLPPPNVPEASLVTRLALAAPATLTEVVAQLEARRLEPPALAGATNRAGASDDPVDLADVVGQDVAKRALEIAAAGAHALLMIGPPGAGKTMLARRLPTILPALTEEEALEVVAIHSVAGLLAPNASVSVARPFRAPHHTLSAAGLIGGGSNPRPGEVSLAHHGVLFLDELQEIPRHVLDALRQPLEDGRVVIARAASAVAFPAQFTLVGAMNPCPCGRAGDPRGGCACAASEIAHHQSRLSGPLADRIDMQVRLSAVPVRDLGRREGGEPSAAVRARVETARARQRERYRGVARVRCNAHAAGRWLDTRTPVDSDARDLLAAAAERSGLSARAYHRVLKVARTIADLDDSSAVAWTHVAEALRYRPLESRQDEPPTHFPTHVTLGSGGAIADTGSGSALILPCQPVASPARSRHAMADPDSAPPH